jgi:hypothetical protein
MLSLGYLGRHRMPFAQLKRREFITLFGGEVPSGLLAIADEVID